MKLPVEIPNFELGKHYRQLPATSNWRFVLMRDVQIKVAGLSMHTIELRDKNGRCWAVVTPKGITIHKGYAWNGCSPKAHGLGRFWGTPDFVATRLASCVHDVLFQFAHVDHLDCTVYEANAIFGEIIRLGGSKVWAVIYKKAVDMAAHVCYPRRAIDVYSVIVIV